MVITASSSLPRAFGPHLWGLWHPCRLPWKRSMPKGLGSSCREGPWFGTGGHAVKLRQLLERLESFNVDNWLGLGLSSIWVVICIACWNTGEKGYLQTPHAHIVFKTTRQNPKSRTQHICRDQQASQKNTDFWVPLHTLKGKVPCKSLEESRHNSWVCLKISGKQVQWLNGFSRTQTWQWKIQSKWFKLRF